MNTVGTVANTSQNVSTQATTVPNPNAQLTENSFLQMMVTQMQYQDPTSPVNNTQFLAQLAQYSTLQQIMNLSSTENTMLSAIQQLASSIDMNMGQQMIGKTVSLKDTAGNSVSGTVSAVQSSNNQSEVVVNGTAYPISSVTSIS